MKINWKYTLGEVLIVTTGILIAFSLNNWASTNAEKSREQLYLKNINTDISNDISLLESNIAELNRKIDYTQIVIRHINNDLPGKDTVTQLFFQIADVTKFTPHETTYQSLINSGDLKLIRNFEIRNTLVDHYTQFKLLYYALERQENFSKTYLADFFVNKIDFHDLYMKHDTSFMNDPLLRNLMYSSFGILRLMKTAHENALKRSIEVQLKIEGELAD